MILLHLCGAIGHARVMAGAGSFAAQITALPEALAWWDLPLETIGALMPVLASAQVEPLKNAVRAHRGAGAMPPPFDNGKNPSETA